MSDRLPILRKIMALAILIALVVTMTLFSGHPAGPMLNLGTEGKWQVLLPEGSGAEQTELPPSMLPDEGWLPLEEALQSPAAAAYRGLYWARITLPDTEFRDPYFTAKGQGRLQAYLDGDLLYSFNMMNPRHMVMPRNQWNMIKLPDTYPGQTLYLKLDKNRDELLQGEYTLSSKGDYIQLALSKDAFKLLFSFCFAAAAVLSLLVYLRVRSQPAYLYFALFSLTSLHACFARTFLLNEFGRMPVITYLHDVSFYLGTFALLAFIRSLFGDGAWGLRGKLALFSLLFSIFSLGAALLDDTVYFFIVDYIGSILFLLIFVADCLLMILQRRQLRTEEVQWTLLGYALLFLSGFSHSFFFLFERLEIVRFETAPILLYFMREDQLPFGILLFMICLVMVLVQRFNQVQLREKQYAGELEEKNRQLEYWDRLKDDFLANTSHELRTPLHGIIGLSESILSDGTAGMHEGTRKNVQLVMSSARRLSRLVDDILDFSKLKHSSMTLHPAPVHLHAAADLVLTVFGPMAARAGIRLVNDIPGDLPWVMADDSRLQQILYNLIGNALNFTDEGEVRVHARAAASGVLEISVSDTGIGIPPQQMQLLFEPFEQAEQAGMRPRRGTGLGLSITRKLVELHGGTISMESAVGSGTTVTFTLLASAEAGTLPSGDEVPAARIADTPDPFGEWQLAADEAGASQERDRAEAHEDWPLILVADDEPVNLQVLAGYLARQPYRILQARSGEEVMAYVERERPSILLLDVMMPGPSGMEICRRLRQQYTPSELPILLLTAKNRIEDLAEGFDAGANDYLTKPIGRRELLARVAIQLQLAQLNSSLEELVAERTAALEWTNRQLKSSMQETVDAMTEVTILEERTRLAQEIHDIVGHSLTVVNIQIEAAKRLIVRSPEQGLEKLDLSQELVRKSLSEVRQSVRMLKDARLEGDLHTALVQLIEETVKGAGVEIRYEVDALPELNERQRRALYRALQEGITNGIRHGGSTAFEFRLRHLGGELLFELSNNGLRFEAEAMGFGLRAMEDRARGLGGTMQVTDAGSIGCRIRMVLPVDGGASAPSGVLA